MKITIEWDERLDGAQIDNLVADIEQALAPWGVAEPQIEVEQDEPTSLGMEPDDDRR